MSREAADELDLEPGDEATAIVKSATVLIETTDEVRRVDGRASSTDASGSPADPAVIATGSCADPFADDRFCLHRRRLNAR